MRLLPLYWRLRPIVCPALSGDAETIRLSKYLPTLPTTHNVAVFVGATARGRDDFADAYVDHRISISEYPLSASVACGKVRLPLLVQICSTKANGWPSDSSAMRSKNFGILSSSEMLELLAFRI